MPQRPDPSCAGCYRVKRVLALALQATDLGRSRAENHEARLKLRELAREMESECSPPTNGNGRCGVRP